ncbi:MAG: SDR family NAD(P)-dependent oxidoreductase [Myxococcaceae bacterium]
MASTLPSRPLAVVTGASSGIGYELARQFTEHGYDVLITAENAEIHQAAQKIERPGVTVSSFEADLAKRGGVESLWTWIKSFSRPIEAIAINAGVGVGGPFAETSLEEELNLVQLNVTSTVHLAKLVVQDMLQTGRGRILFTSSIASEMRSPFEAVYGASKSFIQSFAHSIRAELKENGIVVTSLLPGPTETNFFHRAGMDDTRVGAQKKDDPAQVAKQGFDALMSGRSQVQAGGIKTRMMGYAARVVPEVVKEKMHWRMSEPGGARH